MALEVLERWHRYLGTHDYDELRAMMHPDAVFESPIVHTPQSGVDLTVRYLIAADRVLFNDSFRYVGEWENATGAVLEFVTEVDGITINGVDMISTTDAGRQILNFKVMLRPLKAINLLHQKMGQMLAQAA